MLENAAATSCQNPNFEHMRLSFSWPADEICRPLPTARGSASEKRLQAASPDKEFEITETGEEDGEEEEGGGGGGERKQRVRASYFLSVQKRRWAREAARNGAHPSFTVMVFWPSEGVVFGKGLCVYIYYIKYYIIYISTVSISIHLFALRPPARRAGGGGRGRSPLYPLYGKKMQKKAYQSTKFAAP